MNLFVVEDEYTYYLHLYILGFASIAVEDEYTYYVRLYILDQEPFFMWKMNTHIIYVYIS